MPRISPQYEQARKDTIIAGAAQVFADRGYEQATIDQIAQYLHLSKGAIYIYFKSKEELFVSVLQSIYEQRFTLLSSAFQAGDPVQVKFEKIIDRLGGLVSRQDRVFIRLWIEGFLESEQIPALHAIKTASRRQFQDMLSGLLLEGQHIGQIDPHLDPSDTAATLMALMDGFMLHSLVEGWDIGPEKVERILRAGLSNLISLAGGR